MEKKYQVFISSTFSDLKEERVELMEALINLGHIPVGMELFNAADDTQWGVIKRRIEESDYYVLLISDRYGSVDKSSIGFTEKEYTYALELKKPIISFVRNKKGIEALTFKQRESDYKEKLDNFKKTVSTRLYKDWETKHDLSKKFFLSFAELIREKPQSGWVRFDAVSQENTKQINQLFSKNQTLSDENRKLNKQLFQSSEDFEKLKNLKNTAKDIVEILPKKKFLFGQHVFNGIELVALFGSFVAIESPLDEIVTSIKAFLTIQTQDDYSLDYSNKDSLKYIVGGFASLGLIEIKSEIHVLRQEDGRKENFHKSDRLITIEMVTPTPLLSEVYSKIESINIDGILIVQAKTKYLKKKKRLEELSCFENDGLNSENRDDYLQRKRGKVDSILTEFIVPSNWKDESEKKNFLELDFINDQKAFAELYIKAHEVLKELYNSDDNPS